MQVLLLLSALSLSACGKAEGKDVADAGHPDTSAVAKPAPSVYGEFGKAGYRARFAGDYAKGLELNTGADGFFLPPGYQWKLEEAMQKAGQQSKAEGKPTELAFRQTENAVLAHALRRLFDEWAEHMLPEHNIKLYRNTYNPQLYRHYLNLRYLEVLPDKPMERGNGDIEKLIDDWTARDRKVWALTQESAFFGVKKDPALGGPLDKPLMPAVQRLMAEMLGQFPSHDSKEFRSSYLYRIQFAVLDMYLPGMYMDAIRGRLKLAGLSFGEAGISEQEYEAELKKAFAERGRFFGNGRIANAQDRTERRILEVVSAKFEEFSRMEHPLDLYRHD